MPRPLLFALGLSIAACGGSVQSASGGAGGANVDQECFEACVDKGLSTAECNDWCDKGSSASGKGATTSTATTGGTTGSGTTTTSGGGKLDPELEKSCIDCWYDESASTGQCAEQAAICEADLACQQLQWCPLLCEGENCFEECNEIIPSGVEPLSALVQCMACDGGPCAQACAGSLMLQYCK